MKRLLPVIAHCLLVMFALSGIGAAGRNDRVPSMAAHEGKPVAGRVVDSEGKPVPGAEIRIRDFRVPGEGSEGHSRWNPNGMTVKTGADGRFIIPNLPRRASIRLLVSAKGYALAYRDNVRAGNQNLVFRLVPEGIIEGRVTYGDSGKIAGGFTVTVTGIIPLSLQNTLSATTDARGAYRIHSVPPGEYSVLAVPGAGEAEWAPCEARDISVNEGRTTAGVDIRLVRGGVVTGRVHDRDTVRPIAGLRVETVSRAYSSSLIRLSSVTDPNGVYRIRAAPGKASVMVSSTPKGYSLEWQHADITIPDGGTVSGIDFSFSRGGTLKGKVLLPDGAPAAGVSIIPDSDAREYAWFALAVSDSSGMFTLLNVEEGFSIVLVAEHRKLHLGKKASFRIGESILVRLEPFGMADIGGRVLDEEKRPVEDAEVSLNFINPETNAIGETVKAFTDSLGEFLFPDVPVQGRFVLSTDADGYKERFVPFDSTGAGVKRLPDTVILRTDRFIEGTVTDGRGNPVEGAVVRVTTGCCDEHVEARSNALGRFRLEGLMHFVEPLVTMSHPVHGHSRFRYVTTNERHDFAFGEPSLKESFVDWDGVRKEGLLIEGKPAPAIEVSRWLVGGPLTPDDLKGKLVVLDFWSVRDRMSVDALRLMEALHRGYGPNGVVVIGIHEYTADTESVLKTLAEGGFTFHAAVDAKSPNPGSRGKMFDAYRFAGFPYHVLIDRWGLVNMPYIATDDHILVNPDFGEVNYHLDIESKVRRMRKAAAP